MDASTGKTTSKICYHCHRNLSKKVILGYLSWHREINRALKGWLKVLLPQLPGVCPHLEA